MYIGVHVIFHAKNEAHMQEKLFVTGDIYFEQISDQSAAKSWYLPAALMRHSLANQMRLVTVSISYQLCMHACKCDY